MIAEKAGGTCWIGPRNIARTGSSISDVRVGDVAALDDLALGVVGRGAGAKLDLGVVPLLGVGDQIDEPGVPPDADRQHPLGEGIERAGVADAPRPERAPDDGDDVV